MRSSPSQNAVGVVMVQPEGDGEDGAPGLESAPGQARFVVDGALVVVEGGQVGQGERPQVVQQLAAVVGPGCVVEGVGVGALAIGGADEGDDDGAAGEDIVGKVDGGEEAGAEGVDVTGAPEPVGAEFLHGNGGATAVAGEEEGALVGIGLARVGYVFGIVEGEGGAVFGQVAQAGVGATGEDDVAQVGHLGDGVEEDGLAGAALAAGPEVADDVEGVEEPGGQDKAGDEFGHCTLVGEGAVKVQEAGDDAGDTVEDVEGIRPVAGAVGLEAVGGPGAGGGRHFGQGDVEAEGIEGLVAGGAEEGAVVAEDVEAEAGFDEGGIAGDEGTIFVAAVGGSGAGVEPGGGVGVAGDEGEGAAHDGGRGVEEFDGGMRNGECGLRNGECGLRSGECGLRNVE